MRRGALAWSVVLTLTLAGCGSRVTETTPPPSATATPAPTASPAPAGPLVKTDWSQLTPYAAAGQAEEAVGKRWYKNQTDTLIPRSDYGPLVPYAGASYSLWWMQGLNYGLMTMDGTVVVDPVYSAVDCATYGEGPEGKLPVYILRIGTAGASGDGGERIKNQYALAALDGSWGTGFDYEFAIPGPDGVFLVTGDMCMVMGADGAAVRSWTWADLGYPEGERPTWSPTPTENAPEWCGGKVVLDMVGDQFRLLDTKTGEQSSMYYEDYWKLREERWAREEWTVAPQGDTTLLTRGDKSYTLPVRCTGGSAYSGYAVLDTEDGTCMAYDFAGNELVAPGRYDDIQIAYDTVNGEPYLWASNRSSVYGNYILNGEGKEVAAAGESTWAAPYLEMVNGLAEVITETSASYYRADGTCVFRAVFETAFADD